MTVRIFGQTGAWRLAFAAAALALSGCDAANEAVDAIDNIGQDAEVRYFVSLGTSLAVGVQPNGSGNALPTDEGYPDELYDIIRPAFEASGEFELQLIRLGCPGETLDKMINGDSCPYLAGSQLAAAAAFLADNVGDVHLVTIDMGGNDFREADCVDVTVDVDCADAVAAQIFTDLSTVLAALRTAAGPDTPIIGMNYYNPYLAAYLTDAAGEAYAVASADAVNVLNGYLANAYTAAGMPMADVSDAFVSNDFGTMVPSSQPSHDMLPINVNNICDLTYACDPPPRGPDIHAKPAGYTLIAEAFAAVLP